MRQAVCCIVVVLIACVTDSFGQESNNLETIVIKWHKEGDRPSPSVLKGLARHIQNTATSGEERATALELLVDVSLSLNRIHDAEKAVDSFLKVDEILSDDSRSLLSIAQANIAAHKGDIEQALLVLEQIPRQFPKSEISIYAAYLCARIHLTNDDIEAANNAKEWARIAGHSLFSDPEANIPFWKGLNPTRTPAAKSSPKDSDLFKQALKELTKRQFESANRKFGSLSQTSTSKAIIAGCKFYGGQCLLGLNSSAEAISQWENLSEQDPHIGSYRGDALLALGDYALEYDLNLDRASHWYDKARKRLDAFHKSEGVDKTWSAIEPQIHLRLGLVKYLKKQRKQALSHFDDAARTAYKPPLLNGLDPIPTPAEEIAKKIKSGEEITPHIILTDSRGTKESSLGIFLADFFLITRNYPRTLWVLNRVLEEGNPLGAPDLQLAYALFRRADAHYHAEQFTNYKNDLESYLRRHEKMPWTPDIMMRLAVLEQTKHRESEKAKELFSQIQNKYPDHELAPAALWYYATICRWNGEREEAIRSYKILLKIYPRSGFKDIIQNEILPSLEKE